MGFDNRYNFTAWDLIKLILAVIALILVFVDISAGTKLLDANQNKGKTMTDADYAQIQVGEEINGEIKEVLMEYKTTVEGSALTGYLVMYDNGVVVPFIVNMNSPLYEQVEALYTKQSQEPVPYRGQVHPLTDIEIGNINMSRIAQNTAKQYKLSGKWRDHLAGGSIHATDATATVNEKYIISSFASAVVMFLAAVLLLRKSFGKLVYKIRCTFGSYEEKPRIVKEDVETDMGVYDGSVPQNGNFYLDTEYDFEKKNAELTAARLERERLAREEEIEQNKNVFDKVLDHIPALNQTEEPSPPPQKPIFDSDSFYTGGASEDGFFNESITQAKNPSDDDRNTRKY